MGKPPVCIPRQPSRFLPRSPQVKIPAEFSKIHHKQWNRGISDATTRKLKGQIFLQDDSEASKVNYIFQNWKIKQYFLDGHFVFLWGGGEGGFRKFPFQFPPTGNVSLPKNDPRPQTYSFCSLRRGAGRCALKRDRPKTSVIVVIQQRDGCPKLTTKTWSYMEFKKPINGYKWYYTWLSQWLLFRCGSFTPIRRERRWIIWTNNCIFSGDLLVSGRVLSMDTLGFDGCQDGTCFKVKDLQTIDWMVVLCLFYKYWSFMFAKKASWHLPLIQRGHTKRSFLQKQDDTAYASTFQLRCSFASISYKVIQPPPSTSNIHVKRLSSSWFWNFCRTKKPWLGLNFRTTYLYR